MSDRIHNESALLSLSTMALTSLRARKILEDQAVDNWQVVSLLTLADISASLTDIAESLRTIALSVREP